MEVIALTVSHTIGLGDGGSKGQSAGYSKLQGDVLHNEMHDTPGGQRSHLGYS